MRILALLLVTAGLVAFVPSVHGETVCAPGTATCVTANAAGPGDVCASVTVRPDDSAGACETGGAVEVWRCTMINCQVARVDLSKYVQP